MSKKNSIIKIMKDFVETLQTSKELQNQVASALKQVAANNGLTINEKQNSPTSKVGCVTVMTIVCSC